MLAPPSPAPRCVLVTGGAGFIGAACVRRLLARGLRVIVVDDLSAGRVARLPAPGRGAASELRLIVEDCARPGLLAGLIREERVEVILHLASIVGVRAVLRDPEATRRAILRLSRGLLRELRAGDSEPRPRLVAASTSEVYLEHAGPLSEAHPLRPVTSEGRWAYAAAKRQSELLFDAAQLWRPHAEPLHLRLFNVVGPGQDAGGGMVLPRFVERARAGRPLPIHGDGRAVRTYAHVEAVAEDIARLCSAPPVVGGPLNLGGNAVASVLELAAAVRGAVSGVRPALEHVDPRLECPGFLEVRRRIPDLARARGLGLVRRPWSLESIVADTLARHPAALVGASSRGASNLSCALPAS